MNTLSSFSKVLPLPALLKKLKAHRRRGRRIVFTNGCFDLLHIGHIATLQKAKTCGEILVVGVNSDSSVRKLKGRGRPLIRQDLRGRLLAALACVDYVTIFPETTPKKLLRTIRPEVLVKGADYRPGEIVGREFADRVVRAPWVPGFSTTGLIKKIRKLPAPRSKKP
ncbi:MAG: adenylyltransferase/cytidyltransferase family protein [Elusimicrobia bacterium]|nr:adenylyltransferase/cytidyltransferase family protein [Elusimicrobiota bacterium]